jgi:hypothetical protein
MTLALAVGCCFRVVSCRIASRCGVLQAGQAVQRHCQHQVGPHIEFDRDAAGSTNIGLRGVYRITRRETGSYKPHQ